MQPWVGNRRFRLDCAGAARERRAGEHQVLKRARRMLRWGLVALVLAMASGVLLAGWLAPRASGAPSRALPVVAGQTALDREIEPILARHPAGMTGALLVADGVDAFAARALSARQAGRSLDLMYYIWHDDLTGRLLAREAWLAAERGVRVRLLLDDINAVGKDTALLALDAHPNVEVRAYNPFRNRAGPGRMYEMLQRLLSLNHRMHNKAWIADNRVAVVGGRNIGEEYFAASGESNFHDLDLVLFGPAVPQASAIFDRFWNSTAVVPLAALNRADTGERATVVAAIRAEAQGPAARRYLDRVDASPTVRAYVAQGLVPYYSDDLRILSDPPVKAGATDRSGWLVHEIARTLESARRKALIVSPYFVPGQEGTALLAGMARRGVATGVVTNSLPSNDVAAVYAGYSKYRPALLQAGVKLHEIRAQAAPGTRAAGSASGGSGTGASLHTKAFVVDDARGFIGSFNMDPRSATLNTEMGVFFDDPGIAAALRTEYLRLSGPTLSDWTWLGPGGQVRWLDRSGAAPRVLRTEPGSTGWQRAQARVIRWLPVESQL